MGTGVGNATHWSPTRRNAFEPFVPAVAVSALTNTQVSLAEKNYQYETLQTEYLRQQTNWTKNREELENRLRHMTVSKLETERVLSEDLIQAKQSQAIAEIDLKHVQEEYASFKSSSITTQATLQCQIESLEMERTNLSKSVDIAQRQLRGMQSLATAKEQLAAEASRTATQLKELEAYQAAERRQLESDREDLLEESRRLWAELEAMRHDLSTERSLRQQHQQHAYLLAKEKERLVEALEREREITRHLRSRSTLNAPTASTIMKSETAQGRVSSTINAAAVINSMAEPLQQRSPSSLSKPRSPKQRPPSVQNTSPSERMSGHELTRLIHTVGAGMGGGPMPPSPRSTQRAEPPPPKPHPHAEPSLASPHPRRGRDIPPTQSYQDSTAAAIEARIAARGPSPPPVSLAALRIPPIPGEEQPPGAAPHAVWEGEHEGGLPAASAPAGQLPAEEEAAGGPRKGARGPPSLAPSAAGGPAPSIGAPSTPSIFSPTGAWHYGGLLAANPFGAAAMAPTGSASPGGGGGDATPRSLTSTRSRSAYLPDSSDEES